MEIERGAHVLVEDAFGNEKRRRALTGIVNGHDFEVVWVCTEEEWTTADQEGRQPGGVPWPVEDVRPADNTIDA